MSEAKPSDESHILRAIARLHRDLLRVPGPATAAPYQPQQVTTWRGRLRHSIFSDRKRS